VTVIWLAGTAIGLFIAIWASRHALDAAVKLGAHLGLSSFVIGVTIVAVGTDLPEVANSIIASARDHGDLNVGNSIGSVVTQLTIVTGVLCFFGRLEASRRFVVTVGVMTVLALLTGALLLSDDNFGRADGALLVAFWIGGTFIIQRPTDRADAGAVERGLTGHLVWRTLLFLSLVGVGATVAVESFTRGAEALGAPEYLLSFFVLAAGTSLPELVIDFRALRQGSGDLAMGDLLGSSFVDATLSPGIGPILFPTALSAGVERGSLVAAGVVTMVILLLARAPSPTRWTGIALIGLYLVMYPALLA
jgi:cation:H+ antiporter